MALELTYLGHSGFLLRDQSHALVVDPFLTGNSLAKHKPGDLRCQTIALTHGHPDHLGDTVEIAKKNDAAVLAPYELANYLGEQGVEATGTNPGGKVKTSFGWVAYTQAMHSSSYEGRYMGVACGLMIRMGDATIYHMGDTAIFSDMKLLGEIYRPDLALVPIGDLFTMGPELATRAAEMVKPKVAIPIHYRTFPVLVQDASGFKPAGVEVKVLEPGETWTWQAR